VQQPPLVGGSGGKEATHAGPGNQNPGGFAPRVENAQPNLPGGFGPRVENAQPATGTRSKDIKGKGTGVYPTSPNVLGGLGIIGALGGFGVVGAAANAAASVFGGADKGMGGKKQPPTVGTGVSATGQSERGQIADAARYVGQAIFNYGQWPTDLTIGVAQELPWRYQGFNSAEEWLAYTGYKSDPSRPGVYNRYDPTTVTVTGDGGGYSDSAPSYDYGGGGGWGDYGDYGGYGGGRGYGSGGGSSASRLGLIQWRIGA